MTVDTAPTPTQGFLARNRVWFVVALAFAAAVAITAWMQGGDAARTDRLDPENYGPDGARALAQVLAAQGVEVSIVRDAAALEAQQVDDATTVVVTGAHRLSPSTADRLLDHAGAGRLVLVEPPQGVADLVGDAGPVAPVEADGVAADCGALEDLRLRVDGAVGWAGADRGCFESDGVRVLARAGSGIVLFGAGDALTNDQVLRADNAAIGLRMLGSTDRLVWYLPSYDDAEADEAAGLTDLLPDWIIPGLWLLLTAGIALVLWRARRLGPLSTEPLPVVVRAIETARSRGRMYHRGYDRPHAARALREAALRRTARHLGLRGTADPQAVVTMAAARLERPVAEVAQVLAPDAAPPTTDEALVRLADELAAIEREVPRR